MTDEEALQAALAAIDAANAEDPNRLRARGVEGPKELRHAELASAWIERLVPEPSAALRCAARAHHLRRWELPRSSYPQDRAGYHRWRRELQRRHADGASRLLADAGVDEDTIGRCAALIRKEGLGRDPEAQALEDALCLVFVETQLEAFAGQHDEPKVVGILRRSLAKMSEAGRALAGELELSERARALLAKASTD